MTWATQVSGWVHDASSSRWPGTSSPSRTTTAAISQWPSTTTQMRADAQQVDDPVAGGGGGVGEGAHGGEVHATSVARHPVRVS